MSAVPHLQKQLKDLTQHPIAGFRVEVGDDLFNWTVWFSGPKDTMYHPGQYKAQLTFPQDFPFKPPEFRILSTFWHPNVYDSGVVCISILHAPGVAEDNALESAMERWTPIQSIQSVLISIISLLADPDPAGAGAPANVDAIVMYRKEKEKYASRCKANAEKSLTELPAGWTPPPETDEKPVMQRDITSYSDNVFMDDEGDMEQENSVSQEPKKEAGSSGGGAYASELAQLRGMGVGADKSDDELTALLTKYKGDLDRTCEACWS